MKDKIMKELLYIGDEIITDSNYSMQQILLTGKAKRICNFHPYIEVPVIDNKNINNNFILFVSGGRPEKNLVRAILAFIKYIKESGAELSFVVTGLDKEKEQKLKKYLNEEKTILNKYVQFKGYVSREELNDLYRNCSFLLFPSLNEGYGLPALEAVLHRKPAVLSQLSSIPEIMGAAAVYVDPWSIDSIKEGIYKLMDNSEYEKRIKYLLSYREIVISRMEIENQILMDNLFAK